MPNRRKPRGSWLALLRMWWLLPLPLICVGCRREPAEAPFHRFVEDVVRANRGHEAKVRIGHETRNVLFKPYRSDPKRIEAGRDGSVTIGSTGELQKVSAEASGIVVRAQVVPPGDASRDKQYAPTQVYIPLRTGQDPSSLAEEKIRVLPPGGDPTKVEVWMREVLPLPHEHVTRRVRVPASARLDFGIAVEGEMSSAWPTAILFTVLVEQGRTRRVIFSRTLSAGPTAEEAGWTDVSLELPEYAGSTVRFVFRTESAPGEVGQQGVPLQPPVDSPVWSSPILYSTEQTTKGQSAT